MRKVLLAIAMTVMFVVGSAASASAAQDLPAGCSKYHGTVTCYESNSPGKNRGGVGSLSIEETQGNLTNTSPDPQELQDECLYQNPPSSKGKPIVCPE